MNKNGTDCERGGAMRPKQVELEKRRNRALKALQIALECGDDLTEGQESLEMARSAYASFLGGEGPSRGRFERLKTFAYIAAIAILGVSIYEAGERGVGLGVQAYNGPPFVWGSARFVNDVVEEGEPLQVIASHKFLKPCIWSTTRKWYDDSKTLIASSEVHLPAIPAGPEFVSRRWRIELPDGLKPGYYDFKSTLHAICGDDVWQNEIFEQNFKVVPRHKT